MDEGSFAEHEIEFSVQSPPRFDDCCGIRQHGHGSLYFCQITARYHSRRLVIYSYLFITE